MQEEQSEGSPAPLAGEPPERESSSFALVAQFFIIPFVVVVIAVAVFLVFGALTREKRSPSEYLQEVRTGSTTRRWQAAYEFAVLFARQPDLASDRALFEETLRTFQEAKEQPEVRRYLTLALGRFQSSEALPALVEALTDADEETRLYAALALASLGAPEAASALEKLLDADQPALRKAGAFALGAVGARGAISRLRVSADDAQFDVALQAALSLAQLGDAYGRPRLLLALDRAHLAGAVEMKPEQQSEAVINAIRGLTLLKDRDAVERLKQLSREDPDLRVRDAALRALETLEKP